jgi:hypothetical protein
MNAEISLLWTLIPLSALLGAALLWAFGKLSDQTAIRETKRRLQSRLYEMRLFSDEPRLVWRAQTALLRENLRYLRLTLVPVLLLSIPAWLVFAQLRAIYEWSPLRPGRTSVITVQLRERSGPMVQAPALELPRGFVAESPPVRVTKLRQVSWRVRPVEPASGALRVTMGYHSVSKTISARPGRQYLSLRRASLAGFALWPNEAPVPSGAFEWVQVDYASSDGSWILWLLGVSMLAAFLLRSLLGVQF